MRRPASRVVHALLAAASALLAVAPAGAGVEQVVFGPATYAMPPALQMSEFSLPAGVEGPFRMRVTNGARDGRGQVRLAFVFVNGSLVAQPADFAQAAFEREVALRAQNLVVVVMLAQRGDRFEATFVGQTRDTVPVSLVPNPLAIEAGAEAELTATLSPLPVAPGVLAVSSGDPGIAGVPSSVAFAAGQPAVPVPVAGVAPGTTSVTATLNGIGASATVRVSPAPPRVVALEPPAVAVSVGGSGTLTVRLSAAPALDTEVMLSSSDPGLVHVAGSVTVPAGQSQASLSVEGLAEGRARVTASLDGSSASSEVTVTPAPPTVVSLVPAVSTLALDARTTLELAISASQPADTIVAIESSPPGLVSVPDEVLVPAGELTTTVTVQGDAPGQAGITARLNGSSVAALVHVVSPPLELVALQPERATLAHGATVSFEVAINAIQPGDVEIALACSRPAVLELPDFVVVRAGARHASFVARALAAGDATVTASANGTSRQSTVHVTPEPASVVSLLPSPLPLQQGATGMLTVTIDVAQEDDTVVTLLNDSPAVVEVAESVTVPAGELSAAVPVTALEPGRAVVTAGLNGTSADAEIEVTAPNPVVVSLEPAESVLPKGTPGQLRVTLSRAPQAPTVVAVESSAPAVVSAPVEVTVPAGALAADFPVASLAEGEATLTATLGDSASAHVQVTPAEPVSLLVSAVSPSAYVDDEIAFGALATMTDGSTELVDASWSSSDGAVASIDDQGLARALGPGATTIEASHEFVSAVTQLPTTVSGSTVLSVRVRPVLSLSAALLDLTVGQALAVTLHASEAAPAGGLDVSLAATGAGAASFPAQVRLTEGVSSVEFVLTAVARGPLTLTGSAPGVTPGSLSLQIRDPLSVHSIDPASGPVAATVRLVGSGFEPDPAANQVRFAGATGPIAATVLSASHGELHVRVPPLAESGPIQVTTAWGSAQSAPFAMVREQDFAIVASPAILSVYQGAGGAAQLQLSSTGSQPFTGLVALSVEGVPPGVTAAFVPAASLSASQVAVVELSAAGAMPPGTHAIAVRGRVSEAGQPLTRSASLELVVQAAGGVTGFKGRFVTPDKVGVPGVIVRADVSPTPVQTTSDPAGNFQIVGIPAGPVTLRFDATPANPLYPIWPYTTTLPAGQITELPDWTINPPPASETFTPIANTSVEQVVTDERYPGLEVRLPAGAVITGWDGVPKDRIAVERVELTSLPVPAPPAPTGAAYQLYFGTPMGGVPSTPIPVTLPNDVAAEPGESVDVWFFDGSPMGGSGEWTIAGTATVSGDGRAARMLSGGIPRFCGVCGLMCLGKQQPAPVEPPDPCKYGNPVEPFTGQELPDTSGLRCSGLTPIETGMSYNPVDAFNNVGGTVGSLGFGWVLDYDIAFLPFLGPQKRLVLPGNKRVNFVDDGSGNYEPFDDPRFDGAVFRATNAAAHEWELTFRDRTKWRFRPFSTVFVRGGPPTFVTEMVDPQGNVLPIVRQPNGRILSIGSAERGVTMAYGTNGFVSEIRDSADRAMSFSYTAGDRIETVTDPDGRLTRYSYVGDDEFPVPFVCAGQPSFGERLKTIEYPGRPIATENFYGPGRRVLRQTGYDGREHRFAYRVTGACVTHVSSPSTRCAGASCPDVDSWENFEAGWRIHGGTVVATTITQPNGKTVTHEFSARGMTTARTDAQGQRTTTELDSANRVTKRTDVLGRSWSYRYDDDGNLLEERDPLDRATSYSYDPLWNKVASVTRLDDGGRPQTWSFSYDPANGTLLTVKNPLNETTSFDYTTRGQLELVTTPLSKVTRFEYDGTGDLRKLVDPLGNETRYGYDGAGRPIVQNDPLRFQSRTAYNGVDAVTRLTDARGKVTRLDYDPAGRLFEVRNAHDVLVESYGYDSGDRLETRTDALGRETLYDYDTAGRLETVSDRLGRQTSYAYDDEDRLASVTRPEGVTRYAYDAVGRLTEISDPVSTITYGYDTVDRVVSETVVTESLRTESTYGYDALDRRVSRTVVGLPGESTIYEYDLADRLRGITSRGGTTSYDYDAAGRLRSKTLPNGIRQELDWDDADRLLAITYKDPTDAVIAAVGYGYDANGRRVSQSGPPVLGETPFTAIYDDADRMTQITLSETGQTFDLSYDDEGNLVSKTDAADPLNATTYAWDSQNRLVALSGPGLEASFGYDSLGRRIQKTVNGERVDYVYDGLQAIGEIKNGDAIALLTEPGLDRVLVRYSSGGDRFYLTDAVGSVIAQAALDRSVKSTYAYSPYGQVSVSGDDDGNPIQYTGRENDRTGLYYYRSRYYDPVIKRFLSEDPLGLTAGINRSSYVSGNPLQLVDPLGLYEHHLFPRANWDGYSQNARQIFNRATIETAGRHGWSKPHAEYNEATKELAKEFCKKRGIDPGKMTHDEARQLVEEIHRSKNSKVRFLLDREVGPPRPEENPPRIPITTNQILLFLMLFFYSSPAY